MKMNSVKVLVSVGLFVSLVACGPKLQTVSESATDAANNKETSDPDPSRRETVTVGVAVAEKGAAFRLAGASAFTMNLDGCASGLTNATINETTPNVDVYKFDKNCLIKLTSFTLNGFTYVPRAANPFTSWIANDTAIFEVSGSPTNSFNVKVDSQLSTTIAGTEAVAYSFTQVIKGTDEIIAKNVVGASHALSVSGQDAPDVDIVAVSFVGVTAGGAGQFQMKLECATAVTGVAPALSCGTTSMGLFKYKLVKDTFGGTLTAAQAAAIFDGSETTVANAQKLPTASPSAPNGGFDTITMDGPNVMHSNPNMLLVIQGGGSSYRYFNVDVTIL